MTMMFFIPYILFELPSNILLRRVGPAIWLSGLATLFGVVSLCCGFVGDWTELLGCRVVLGALEAGELGFRREKDGEEGVLFD